TPVNPNCDASDVTGASDSPVQRVPGTLPYIGTRPLFQSCTWADMEQEDECPAACQAPACQSPKDNKKSTPAASVPSGNSGVHQPAAIQRESNHLCYLLRNPHRMRVKWGHRSFCPYPTMVRGNSSPAASYTFPDPWYIHQPGRMIDKASHTMSLGSPGTLVGVNIAFSENLMPHSGLPGSAFQRRPIPASTGSLNNRLLLVRGMASRRDCVTPPSMDRMLHLNPYNLGMPPARLQLLLTLDSQDSFVTQSNSQEGPLRKHTGEKPCPACVTGKGWTSSFFCSDELGRRRRIHTRDRPHKCSKGHVGLTNSQASTAQDMGAGTEMEKQAQQRAVCFASIEVKPLCTPQREASYGTRILLSQQNWTVAQRSSFQPKCDTEISTQTPKAGLSSFD
ncbi:hypothetical protein U0070_016615, partial [Myodes glareolus]